MDGLPGRLAGDDQGAARVTRPEQVNVCSIAQLTLAVAARRQVPVAYVPGLVMRRAADLCPGEAKTDKRDAFIIADTGLRAPSRQAVSALIAPT